jgi:hypothetical protein
MSFRTTMRLVAPMTRTVLSCAPDTVNSHMGPPRISKPCSSPLRLRLRARPARVPHEQRRDSCHRAAPSGENLPQAPRHEEVRPGAERGRGDHGHQHVHTNGTLSLVLPRATSALAVASASFPAPRVLEDLCGCVGEGEGPTRIPGECESCDSGPDADEGRGS